jgi:hypothetical protein
MPSAPPDSMIRRRPRVRIEVSDPTYLDGRWCCTGKILGAEFGHLPWLGVGERPHDPDDDPPTATLFLVAGVGKTAGEARKQVMAKLRNVWGTESTPPPGPNIQEVETIRGHGAARPAQDDSFLSRLVRFLKRRAS